MVLAGIGTAAPATPAGADQASAYSAAAGPQSALARYLAAGAQIPDWSPSTVELEAAIPRLAKRGRLRAIRRSPAGKPEYQVLAMEGDRVRQQVIARYLAADVDAAVLPTASVAIAPVNYRFRYRGSATREGRVVYIFEIRPQKKRAGLISGHLWIDAATGLALRLTGSLVKMPSIFVRRIAVTRETSLHDGVADARTTLVRIDTRLVGRAELTVTERPYGAAAREEVGPAEPAEQHAERK